MCDDRSERMNEEIVKMLKLGSIYWSVPVLSGSLYLTEEERRATALNTMSVLRHMAVGGLLVALDLVVFWLFDAVHQLAQREIFVKGEAV